MRAGDRERPKQSWDLEKKAGKMVARCAGTSPGAVSSWGCGLQGGGGPAGGGATDVPQMFH